MPQKKRKSSAQVKAQNKFKKKIKEAKKIQKQHPEMSWKACLKKAWCK